jgi:3',5'-cyclic AMP phosphodiesterase CpdA
MKRKKKGRKLRIFLIAVAVIAVGVVGYNLISGYLASRPHLDYIYYTGGAAKASYPDAKFAVMSDLHAYDHSLGTSGAAFDKVMLSDRKLLLDSFDLINLAIDSILESDVEFVLIPGDLTKDAELINHTLLAAELQRLIDADIKVFVVPGNHDYNNPVAEGYDGDNTYTVPDVSAAEFAAMYADMGYGNAISRDADSLSYITEAKPGLWILGIDFCRSDENVPGGYPKTGGRLKESTMKWMAGVLERAVNENAAVIALAHHGVVEHWNGQAKLHPAYLVADYLHVGKFLASYNVRVVFTGHYHAQDIVRADFDDGKYLYDVETGSIVTYPCPMRFIELRNGMLDIKTDTIIYRLRPDDPSFADDAKAFVKQTVYLEAYNTLKGYYVSDKDSDIIADAVSDAFVAHYYGDEVTSERPDLDKRKLGLWGRIVLSIQSYVLDGMWVDLPPADNNVTLNLR